MTITDGDKTISLEELAQKLCDSIFTSNEYACWDGNCPAADYCSKCDNGMIKYLREVLKK